MWLQISRQKKTKEAFMNKAYLKTNFEFEFDSTFGAFEGLFEKVTGCDETVCENTVRILRILSWTVWWAVG